MKKTILALALALSAPLAAAGEVVVHTGSVHFGPGTDGLNNFNPGLGYDFGSYQVGGFYNSYELPSFYGAWKWNVTDRISFGVGAITGYTWDSDEHHITGKRNGVIPLVAVGFRVTKHIGLTYFGQAISLEVRF